MVQMLDWVSFFEGQDLYLTLWSMQALTLPCSNHPIPSVWIAIMDDSGSCSGQKYTSQVL